MATKNEARRTGSFILSEASGTRSREAVLISKDAGALQPGQLLGKLTLGGHYYPHTPAANNGSEIAVAILYAAVPDNGNNPVKATVIARDAEVSAGELVGLTANAVIDLEKKGIIVRGTVAA